MNENNLIKVPTVLILPGVSNSVVSEAQWKRVASNILTVCT